MRLVYRSYNAIVILIALGTVLSAMGCGVHGGVDWVGNVGVYNYSPAVIQTGSLRQVWWCGQASNPADSRQKSDAILYEAINLTTKSAGEPQTVMAETPHSWDSVYTCNPRVISGTFTNPLSDGQSYKYAMYYVGTAALSGMQNSIGVAFSNDGVTWKKYPQPIIRTTTSTDYGVGQPVAYNTDGKSAVTLFYEDIDASISHVAATSTDGVHFIVQGTLTTAGLDPDNPNPSWSDMAFDSKTSYWYAVFNRQLRPEATTGGVIERGQLGVELYRIPASSLLTGATPWQQLATIDTNLTGYESNFLAGLVHDQYGNLNIDSYPVIQMYVTESDPQPAWNASPASAAISAGPTSWQMHLEEWDPTHALLALARYYNGNAHEVTTGWINSSDFDRQLLLGHLYPDPQQQASVVLYGCKRGNADYFVSLGSACEGARVLGKEGYGYSQPVPSLNLIPLYRCSTGHDHFVSNDSHCEGQTTDEFLGYALP